MPDSSARRREGDVLTLNEVNVSYWTDVDKILETDITEAHSLYLEINPLGLLGLSDANESVGKPGFVYFFLYFFPI